MIYKKRNIIHKDLLEVRSRVQKTVTWEKFGLRTKFLFSPLPLFWWILFTYVAQFLPLKWKADTSDKILKVHLNSVVILYCSHNWGKKVYPQTQMLFFCIHTTGIQSLYQFKPTTKELIWFLLIINSLNSTYSFCLQKCNLPAVAIWNAPKYVVWQMRTPGISVIISITSLLLFFREQNK